MIFAALPHISDEIIGSSIAVMGAIGVIFLSEWWRARKQRRELVRNFLKELRYLRTILQESRKSVERMITQLGVDAKTLYFSHTSSNMLAQSTQKAYEDGLLYERLSPERIAKFNSEVLVFFGNAVLPIEQDVNDRIKLWQKGELTKQEMYETLDWLKVKTDDAINLLTLIEKDFKKARKEEEME